MTKKRETTKKLMVEQLKKTPIVQVSCEKVGLGRATFYRWKKDDEAFSKNVDDALLEGNLLVNDLAESQLINAIKNSNLGAIVFWLKHHHPNYATKVEVTAHLKHQNEILTPEQEALVKRALKLASLLPEKKGEVEDDK
ncbi:hypothetical protein C4564_02515 [Candidatus Microgenomates bacterium]|nr:MAG: hypothetical protein C4564_02515 [Candidatus Microgenomates bacterium]